MRNRVLLILAIAIVAPCRSSPDEVDDFKSIASSLAHKNSDIKITDEKRVKTIEIKSQNSDQSAFLSHYLHQGHNLFFKPQILLGTSLNNPFISHKPEENKVPDVPVLPDTEINKDNESKEEKPEIQPVIPEAPLLPPLEMPVLPETVVVEDEVQPLVPCDEVIIEEKPILIPQPPAFISLNPPNIPIEVIVPKPLPHVPICLVDNNYGVTVPCPPAIAVSPQIVNIKKVVENTLIVPEPSPILSLPLPKIPLGILYNKPVKTIVPYSEGFISTTRFLPSVKVSKISLEKFSRQEVLQIPGRPLPEVIVEKIGRNRVRIIEEAVPSFSAFCAHNIALERVVPNIVEGRGIVSVAPLTPILEIPVRPVF